MPSKIEWTEETWNPVRGCSHVSPGCDHCYAERMASRFSLPGQAYEGLTHNGKWNGYLTFDSKTLEKPLKWKKPRMVFVNSMSDLFHYGVEEGGIAQMFAVMAAYQQHTFQILTKRPKRMHDLLRDGEDSIVAHDTAIYVRRRHGYWMWPLPNVWLGVTAENQQTADERIPLLLQTPAALRFVSFEPLLGPIQWPEVIKDGRVYPDWIIVGAESGPGARPMEIGWARQIVKDAILGEVPVFVKQLCDKGRKIPFEQWPEDLQIRQFPEVKS